MKNNLEMATKLRTVGRPGCSQSYSVNPSLNRASTTLFSSLAEFRKSYLETPFEQNKYGRTGTSTTFEFQSAMAKISNTQSCIATSCGLSACTNVLDAYGNQDQRILIFNEVYGPVRSYAEHVLKRRGVDVEYFSDESELANKVNGVTSLIYIEVPASLTMNIIDVHEVVAIARKLNIPVACDATWGTPCYFDAHAHGIHIAIHAVTKYINGHSDVMMGAITGRYEDLELVRDSCALNGNFAAPDSCWLALRGLRTLDLRLEAHAVNAIYVAQWLEQQSQVKQVHFPALTNNMNYPRWKTLFTGAPGPFSLELIDCSEAQFERFIDALKLFGLGTSWGGFESLVMPAVPHHLRATRHFTAGNPMVRLHIGLEDKKDLVQDLEQALRAVNS